jgi:hypothetical protein
MRKSTLPGIIAVVASSVFYSCSTTAPDINHLMDGDYHSADHPIAMKVDLGPFSNKDFHLSELNTAIGLNQKIFIERYWGVEAFENINFNPQAGLSVSFFNIDHFIRGAMNGFISMSVIGDRRRNVDSHGGYLPGIAWTHYAPLLYGIQSRLGPKFFIIGIDYVRNSCAFDGRVWKKKVFWDYFYGPLEFYRNPISENYVLNEWKFSVTTKIPLIGAGLSLYFSPATRPLLNRVGIELSDSPKVE